MPSAGAPCRPTSLAVLALPSAPWSAHSLSGLPAPSPPAAKTSASAVCLASCLCFVLSLRRFGFVPFTPPYVFSPGELISCFPLSGSHPDAHSRPRTSSQPGTLKAPQTLPLLALNESVCLLPALVGLLPLPSGCCRKYPWRCPFPQLSSSTSYHIRLSDLSPHTLSLCAPSFRDSS